MLDHIRQTVRKYGMLNPGERVIVAVSGGPDSVALLQVLNLLSVEYDLLLTVAHLNHGLRGAESDAEEKFVRRLCEEREIDCAVKRIDLQAIRQRDRRKRSLEDIGREERYRFFTTLASEIDASRIALGHHREDQAETVLMNLIRGSSLEGLKGILPVRDGCFIRPLLEVGRAEIFKFLCTRHIPFLEDSSNGLDLYLRNRIRHQLIPLLQEQYNPRIVNTLNRIAQIARREDACLKTTLGQILESWKLTSPSAGGEMVISISELLELPEALQYRMIKTLLQRYVLLPHRITTAHIQAILDLSRGLKPEGLLLLPGNVVVKRENGKLTIALNIADTHHASNSLVDKRSVKYNFFYALEIPGIVEIKEICKVVKTTFAQEYDVRGFNEAKTSAYFDFEKVQMPLVIRNRREGDRFQPLGMTGTKKLKAYFIDEKVPRRQRDLIPLLVDRLSVIWIPGLQLSERVRVEKKSSCIVKIEII